MSQSAPNGSPSKSANYDPNQNPEEKRLIRKRYRGLLLDESGLFIFLELNIVFDAKYKGIHENPVTILQSC